MYLQLEKHDTEELVIRFPSWVDRWILQEINETEAWSYVRRLVNVHGG